MRRFSLVVFAGLWLVGCGEERVEPAHEGPLFSVEVVDSAGLPVEGLEVGRVNHPASWVQVAPMVPMSLNYYSQESGWTTIDVYDYYGSLMAPICDSQISASGLLQFSWDASRVRQGFYCVEFRFVPRHGAVRVDSQWIVVDAAPDTNGCVMGITGADGKWATDDTSWFPGLLGNPPHVMAWGDTLSSRFGACPVKTTSPGESEGAARSAIDDMPVRNLNAYRDTITLVLRDPEMTKMVTMEAALAKGANHFRVVWPREH